ncbi:Protein roadkill [Araneus ventricosus]|uniref:Protein roadkill n=1 Tax=Araneus ventricosus TaxID=182803 RepID=A0A4Y2NSV3_ARAVE|nr:Protein roadkill [Araneus ventricosus]
MNGVKQKRNALTVKQKLEILQKLDNGESASSDAEAVLNKGNTISHSAPLQSVETLLDYMGQRGFDYGDITAVELYPKGDILDPDQESIIICLKNCAKLPHTYVNCDLCLLSGEFSSREHFSKFPTGKVHDCAKWRFKRLKENSRFLSGEKVDDFAKATLIVTCQFSQKDSVMSKGSPATLSEKDIDLLSKDMEKMYISKEFNDLTLCSGTENFPIHKAVLYARVPKLLNELQSEADDESTCKVVSDLDASALRILLSYMYSGKLDASTENIPSSLYKAADAYELIDLKQKLCSYPNEVTARTCIKVDRNEFIWPIPDPKILEQHKKLYSPSFTGGIIPGSDLKLSCYLSTNSEGNDSTLEICIHRLFPNKDNPIFVKCKFNVNNLSRVAEHVFYSDEEWHFPSFIPIVRKSGNLYVLHQESLTEITLKCEFCISGGETVYTEETYCSPAKYESFVQRGEDASNLCSDLGVLYNIFLPKVSDVVLTVGAVNFPAHKVVLAARSPVFARMFENDMIEKKSGIVDIKDIDIAILNMMLTYMYSAKVETLNYDSAVKLYTAADRYEVIALKEHCSSFLKLDLSASNACDILILADMHGDMDLKNYTKDFICAHADVILEMPEWNRLIESRIELAAEILHSLTVIVRAQNKGCASCEKTKMG